MEQMNLQISQILQPTLNVQIVQNNAPVVEAKIVIGGGGAVSVVFGDTMTGTGTPSDPVNVSNDILERIQNNSETAEENASQITEIQRVIPATANSQNQLADQGFVNSSIQTATAYFRGDWATWADVPSDPALYPADATGNHTPITNDYMVVIADEQENGGTWRYKYTGLWSEQGKDGWRPEYQVNETPLTAAQLAALNSGVTAQAVADISTNKSNITALQNGKQDKLTAGDGITIDGNTISASGGGASLPDQTGNAGKFLTTDGATASWSDKPLVNKADTSTQPSSLLVGDNVTAQAGGWYMTAIGSNTTVYNTSTVYGYGCLAQNNAVSLGYKVSVIGSSVGVGHQFNIQGNNTVVVARGLNRTLSLDRTVVLGFVAGSATQETEPITTSGFYWGTGKWVSETGKYVVYKLFDEDGNVPLERLTHVTNQIGDISAALTAILGE